MTTLTLTTEETSKSNSNGQVVEFTLSAHERVPTSRVSPPGSRSASCKPNRFTNSESSAALFVSRLHGRRQTTATEKKHQSTEIEVRPPHLEGKKENKENHHAKKKKMLTTEKRMKEEKEEEGEEEESRVKSGSQELE